MRGVGVEQAQPEFAVDLVQFLDQAGERRAFGGVDLLARAGLFLPQIHAEIRRVLTDEVDLFHALGDERTDFRDDALDGARAVFAAHLRDDAKAARMIAAFGDLRESGVRWGEAEARGVEIGDVNRFAGDEVERLPRGVGEGLVIGDG